MRDQSTFLERALLDDGRVTREQMDAARKHSVAQGVDLMDALVAVEAIGSREIALVKADLCEVPFVDLTHYEASFANTRLLSRAVAERYTIFPLFHIDGVITLLMDDPLNLEAVDHVRQATRADVDAVVCDRERLRALIARAYSLGGGAAELAPATPAVAEATTSEAGGPVVAAVNQFMIDAIEHGASDVHINPDEGELRLRYRIDGVLHEQQAPPLSMHAGIVQRLKIMANLDLTQTRRTQDGKFRFTHQGVNVEVRLSCVPTVCGENIVLRLLAGATRINSFHELGIPAPMAAELEAIIAMPHGMLLVTGPTGSGKTTTLYTALNRVNHPSRNVMTIEDPVEIRLPYVRQVQVHAEIGLTFAATLRALLRQDPDVVLLGEIRDEETATIALQAALTGHLVLSTLHTNDAPSAIARLRNFGLPSFVINSALLGVIAQRLVRRVCTGCAGPQEVDELTRRRFGLEPSVRGFLHGRGCGRCGQSGYKGRVGIYELVRLTPALQAVIESGASTEKIREAAVAGGMRLMWQDGLEKARLGQTTLAEISRAAMVSAIEHDAPPARMAA